MAAVAKEMDFIAPQSEQFLAEIAATRSAQAGHDHIFADRDRLTAVWPAGVAALATALVLFAAGITLGKLF
jgi:hypothetical protein